VSDCHFAQFLGQLTSAHSTALYTANVFSLCAPHCSYWEMRPLVLPLIRYWESAWANDGHTAFRYPPRRMVSSSSSGPIMGPFGPLIGVFPSFARIL
jgi:hypothetical protein